MRPDDQLRYKVQSTDDSRKNRVLSNRVINGPEKFEEAEETEITAQISVPHEGGWGWVVVATSFCSIFILDGIVVTYGSLFNDITEDLEAPEALVALVNSIALALYFVGSPLASAFINRFGFRACAMAGSIICSISVFFSYFATTITTLCVFYGFFTGFGYSFINMSTNLVVGFYFERLRSLALAIATAGSSVGITVIYPFNVYIIKLSGWRILMLIHSGFFGLIYFFSMAYKPLLSLAVVNTTDDATRTVTYLPSLVSTAVRATPSRTKTEGVTSTATERLFSAVSNAHFPTAAKVVQEDMAASSSRAGPSTVPVSKLTLTAHNPHGTLSQRQLQQVNSLTSKANIHDKLKTIEVTVEAQPPKKRSWWARLFHWEEHVEESRPMYRDDAFYDGRIEKLPAYQRSMIDSAAEAKTGLEYQMAVTRAATTADLKDKRGVFTTAVRRILVTMMDPRLLARCSFRCLALSGCLLYFGYIVPYIFMQDRSMTMGIDPVYCDLYVSVIGVFNIVGKLVIGALACKMNPLKLYYSACILGGLATMASNLSYNPYYQFIYCIIYGFFVGSLNCLRSVLIVDLYGLERLTNATGILYVFQGLGILSSTPLASTIKGQFGYAAAFYVSGFLFFSSGVVLLPVASMCKKEDAKENSKNLSTENPKPTNVQESK